MIKLLHAPLSVPVGDGDEIRKHQNFSLQYDYLLFKLAFCVPNADNS
jgi:hypothetical protein